MPTTDPTSGWALPEAADPPNGPSQLTALAADIADTVTQHGGSYTPSLTRADGTTSVASANAAGNWARVGNLVVVDISLTVNVAVADFAVHLPFKAAQITPLLGHVSDFGGDGPTAGDAANWVFTFRTYASETRAVWMAATGGWRAAAAGATVRLGGTYLAVDHPDFPQYADGYTITQT